MEKHQQLSSTDYEKLETEIESLKAQLEDKTQQGADSEEKFNRLRRQAQEKLKASKLSQDSFIEQLNELKDAKLALEKSLNNANARIQDWKMQKVAENRNQLSMIKKLQEDTEENSKELETKLEENAFLMTPRLRN